MLLERIRKGRAGDAVGDLRGRAGALKKVGEGLERRLTEVQRDARVQSEEGRELRKRREGRETRIASFEDAAGRVGIAAEELRVTEEAIKERWTREKAHLEEMERDAVGRRWG